MSLSYVKLFLGNMASGFRSDFRSIMWERPVYFLTALQTVFFFYHIFIMNDIGLSLLSAMAVDHAAMMASMDKILASSGFYNMNEGPHSIYYGWTYFFISFLFLAPLKLFACLLDIEVYPIIFIGLKILHFFYGLLATIAFYYLARKFFNPICSFVLAVILMLASALTQYEYTFHPESIGVLFISLSSIYIINLWREKKEPLISRHHYYATLLLLVLGTLAKPTFLLIGLPLYGCLLACYLKVINAPLLAYVKSTDFFKLIVKSTALSIITFFIIHPFFFIELRKSIGAQVYNTTTHSNSPLALNGIGQRFDAWAAAFQPEPLLLMSLMLLVPSILYSATKFKKNNFEGRVITFFLIAVILNALFTFSRFKLFITTSYLTPIMPFLLLNTMAAVQLILTKLNLKPSSVTILASFLIAFMAFPKLLNNGRELWDFYHYKDRVQYQVYNYIRSDIPDGSIIIHDHFVGLPDNKDLTDIHYWHYSGAFLRNKDADYIMFDPNLKFNGQYQDTTIALKDKVATGKYRLAKVIGTIEIWQSNEP